MSLAIGTRIGPYQVIGSLGEGGMGEVYRARDARLNRDTAIKVLPAAVAQDAERVARFRREAQVLAALNHPNIAAIHGLEETDDTVALVLEYVDGEDLAERLRRGAIPLDEALAIARQIAEGLEAAHGKGIVHRDLKPANIKIGRDGTVKILDFGLAKALDTDASSSLTLANSPTILSPVGLTVQGMILGTAAYMSPEQARGAPVDRRTDVWALGCVLYEMLTGRRSVCQRRSFRHHCRRSSRRAGLAGSPRRHAATDSLTARTLLAKGSAAARARCGGRAHRSQ